MRLLTLNPLQQATERCIHLDILINPVQEMAGLKYYSIFSFLFFIENGNLIFFTAPLNCKKYLDCK